MSSGQKTPSLVCSLRRGDKDDLKQILAIERLCQPAPWTGAQFEAELAKPYSHLLVMTDDETDSEIVGFIIYWKMMDEAEILDLCVHPQYQRQGFAQRMVRQVVSEALRDGLKRVLLDVRKSNAGAISLYQNLGFTVRQVRKQFYSNGEDGYTMAVDMSGPKLDF